jgi:hypothetical protein
MTEVEWLGCTDLEKMLDLLPYRVSKRKWRLLGVAFARRIWHLLSDSRRKRAVDAAEQWADGAISLKKLRLMREEVPLLRVGMAGGRVVDGSNGVAFSAASPSKSGTVSAASCAARAVVSAGGSADAERSQQCHLIRDIMECPYRPLLFVDPVWLVWNGGTVRKLAQSIYDERAFDRLPVLADALEDAGCPDTAILEHCRSGGEHMRGCWVVDLLLGKG